MEAESTVHTLEERLSSSTKRGESGLGRLGTYILECIATRDTDPQRTSRTFHAFYNLKASIYNGDGQFPAVAQMLDGQR